MIEISRENPARVVLNEKTYLVYPQGSIWFFQLAEHPDAGWTSAGKAAVKQIEEQFGIYLQPETGFPEDGGGPAWIPPCPIPLPKDYVHEEEEPTPGPMVKKRRRRRSDAGLFD